MIRSDKCDNCKRTLGNGSKVTAIIPDVIVTTKIKEKDFIRLKLSPRAIEGRAVKIYCSTCLALYNYITPSIDNNEEE